MRIFESESEYPNPGDGDVYQLDYIGTHGSSVGV